MGKYGFFGTPGNPNEKVKVYDGFGKGKSLVETITKGELWDQDSGFRGVLYGDFVEQNKNNTWNMAINGGEFEYSPLKKGEDFELVSENKLLPLLDAYNNPSFRRLLPNAYYESPVIYYLVHNDFKLETGTDEWIKLTEIIGEKNMPKYIDFLENTLDIYIVQ